VSPAAKLEFPKDALMTSESVSGDRSAVQEAELTTPSRAIATQSQ